MHPDDTPTWSETITTTLDPIRPSSPLYVNVNVDVNELLSSMSRAEVMQLLGDLKDLFDPTEEITNGP